LNLRTSGREAWREARCPGARGLQFLHTERHP
jgi:hypothetical protein